MLSLKEQTMLGDIPSDWQIRSLASSLMAHYPGDWGDDGGPNLVKCLRSTNLTNSGPLDFSDVAVRSLPQDKAKILAPHKNDILVERSGGGPGQPVGRVAFVDQDLSGYAFSNFLHLLRPDERVANARFLGWVLYQINRTGRIIRLEQQTTQMRNLNFRDYLSMPLPQPCTHEQAAIARILDAVNTAIERTRSALDSAAKLRLSLMQAAFSFEFAASKARKESGVGMIPADWEVVKGKQCFTILTGGNSSVDALRIGRSDSFNAWFMKVDDFNNPANRWGIQVTKIGFEAKRNPSFRLLPLQTVIIAKRGAAILKNRVRTTKAPIALDPNLMALQPAPDVLPDFLKYQLEWRNLSRYVESSGVPQLNNKDLYPRLFLKAPESEQKQIIELIEAAERKQEAIGTKFIILEQLKKSLMQDLLTGKVRVPTHLTESKPMTKQQPQQ